MLDFFSTFLILLFTIALYLFLNKNSSYWKARNVPFLPPLPFLGNLTPLLLLKKSPGQFLGYLYNCPQAVGQKFLGIFVFNNVPSLLIRDPELIKNILIKDFNFFSNRTVQCNEKSDPLGHNNLFVLRGSKWKYLRAQLSPTFTSGKIKHMFRIVKENAVELLKFLEKNTENEKGKSFLIVETKNVLARYTMDVISACAFGLNSGAIQDPMSPFRYFGDKIFDMTIKRSIEVRAFFFMPFLAKIFDFVFLQKQSTQFFEKIFDEALHEREKSGVVRNDFLDTLIKLKNGDTVKLEDSIGEDEEIFEFKGNLLLAQPVLFYTAGFETTATTISMALYELAIHPEIQDRLREEIVNGIEEHGGEITYDAVFEMKYLEMVVSETLRKYPPMPFIDRVCTMDYQIPGSDVVIRKNTPIFISLYDGLHYDEKYFPAPHKFDPERFTEENKKTRHPFSYIPFGEGPRICIGKRFALMNVKTGLCFILKNFRVEICEKTEIPLEICSRQIVTTAKNGNRLKFVKI